MSDIEIRESDGRAWGRLSLLQVGAAGRISPRLLVNFSTIPPRNADCKLLDVSLRLEYGGELVGEGHAGDIDVRDHGSVSFEVQTRPELLRYVTAGLAATATIVEMSATLRGCGRYTLLHDESPRQRMVTDPEPGVPTSFSIHPSMPTPLQVARADWYDKVLDPTNGLTFSFLELALPALDEHRQGWQAALARFKDAERSYAVGDDAAVFLHLRGSLDALPGAKTDIVGLIGDDNKRRAVDNLLQKLGVYLHSGRHVADSGPQVGTFPVDHLDAALVLDLMRVLLAHLSGILAAEQARRIEGQ